MRLLKYSYFIDMNDNLKERIEWAIQPFENSLVHNVERIGNKTAQKIREEANLKEKQWGNKMIKTSGTKINGNWTTLLGEGLVYDILKKRNENPRKPQKRGNYSPDWETDNFIYEVKTRNWTTSGTAGEKVYGTMYKYSDIYNLYNKPLKIICIAYQEWELIYSNTKIFGEISHNKKEHIELAKKHGIEYVKFSDFVKDIAEELEIENLIVPNVQKVLKK